jgi:hypothetical protein
MVKMMKIFRTVFGIFLPTVVLLGQFSCRPTVVDEASMTATSQEYPTYSKDGRMPLDELYRRFGALSSDPLWRMDTVYTYAGGGEGPILSWRTARTGQALWIIAGIHGEEPAGPNAIAQGLKSVMDLAASGVPVVVTPMCNPRAYRRNWRYPNVSERDWRKGGYSVGDAEYLLPDLKDGAAPRAEKPAGPETAALTTYALQLTHTYPPVLVIDFHEDELSTEGGYIYSQGRFRKNNPVGAEIIRLLKSSRIPIRLSGHTRFGESINEDVIDSDEKGGPLRDGSIDELLGSESLYQNGKKIPGPSANTVIVVETPAFSGSRLDVRVEAHRAIVDHIKDLWQMAPRP